MADRWDHHFLRMALECAAMSKDPSTRVGAVLVDHRAIVGTGFNGLPRGIADTQGRLADRDTRLRLVVHAEVNAILNAARVGACTLNTTLYIAATDSGGAIWGGPPCVRCAVHVIQAGITEVVSYPFKSVPSRWRDDLAEALSLLAEAGVGFREVPLPAIDVP